MAAKKATSSRKKVSTLSRKKMIKDEIKQDISTPVVSSSSTVLPKKNGSFLQKVFLLVFLIVLAGLVYYFRNVFIAATVNGEPISRLSVVQELEKQGGKQALESLITQTLIFQEARKQNVSVTSSDIDAEVAKVEENVKSQGQTLDALLTAQGMNREQLREQLKIRVLVERMVAKDIAVTDEEIAKYMADNKSFLPKDKTQDEIKAQVKQLLSDQKLSTKVQEWITNLRGAASISTWVNY
jgi:foldase protein PrsA